MNVKIDRYLSLVIILALSFASLQYAKHFYIASQAPDGYVFGIGQEQVTFLAAINSYIWDFKMPYGATDRSYFENSWIGSLYLFAFMGMLSGVISVDAFAMFSMFNFFFSFLYVIAIYYLIKIFVKDSRKALWGTFFFMIVSAGIGWIPYIFFNPLVESISQDAFLHILGRGGFPAINGSLHWASALFFAYIAFIFYLKAEKTGRNNILYLISIGVSTLIYPPFGIIAAAIIFLHNILYRKIKRAAVTATTVALFALPWMIFTSPEIASLYLLSPEYTNVLAFFALGIFLIIFSLPFIFSYFKRKDFGNTTVTFLILWLVIITTMALMPPQFQLPVNSQRYVNLVFLPWSIAAILGIDYINLGNIRIKEHHKKYIYAGAIMLTLPTIILWYASDLETLGYYYAEKDVNALLFLQDRPQGVVLTWQIIGLSSHVPYYAEKQSLRGGGITFDSISITRQAVESYTTFYSPNSTTEEKLEALRKSRVRYVVYGTSPHVVKTGNRVYQPSEPILKNAAFGDPEIEKNADPELIEGLKKIYDKNGVRIYEFLQ